MSVQRYISSSFWSDDWVDTLSVEEKLAYMYLLTNEYTNIAGVYRITVKNIRDGTGIPRDNVIAALEKFNRDKKAFYLNEYIIIPKWPKHQKLGERGKLRMGVNAILRKLPQEIIDFIMQPGNYEYDTSFLLNGHTPSIPHNESGKNDDGVSRSKDMLSEDDDPLSNDSDSDLDSDISKKERYIGDSGKNPKDLFLHYWQHNANIFNALSGIESPKEWDYFWDNSRITCEQVETAMENFIADFQDGYIEPRFVPAMPDRFVLKGWLTKCQFRLAPKGPPLGTAPPSAKGQSAKKSLEEG